MLDYIVQFFSLHRSQLQVPLAGLLLTVGTATSTAPTGKLPALAKDGIYLYGQSSEPEQIGQEYMVFEVRQGKVMGAFYLPRSEFSCFQGTLQSGKLAVMVANSPDLDTYPDFVAGQNQQIATASNRPPIAKGYEPIAYPYSVALQNYHQLASVSANDQKVLSTCKNIYQR